MGIREYFTLPSSDSALVPSAPQIIPQILSDVDKLLDAVKAEDVRLYTASTLIIYEGDESAPTRGKGEVRLIDFAHAHFEDGIGVDEGAVLGLSNLKKMLEGLVQEL